MAQEKRLLKRWTILSELARIKNRTTNRKSRQGNGMKRNGTCGNWRGTFSSFMRGSATTWNKYVHLLPLIWLFCYSQRYDFFASVSTCTYLSLHCISTIGNHIIIKESIKLNTILNKAIWMLTACDSKQKEIYFNIHVRGALNNHILYSTFHQVWTWSNWDSFVFISLKLLINMAFLYQFVYSCLSLFWFILTFHQVWTWSNWDSFVFICLKLLLINMVFLYQFVYSCLSLFWFILT